MGQIGTIKLQSGSAGVISVPVFAVGDSGSNVYEFVRVETAGGTGFIPITSVCDATFSYIRVQTQNDGILAVHDSTTVPTSGITSLGTSTLIEDSQSLDWGAVAYNSDNIFVGSTESSNDIFVYDKNFNQVDTFTDIQPAAMVATSNYLFLSDANGHKFRKLDASDGTEQWSFSYDDEQQYNWMDIDDNNFTYIGDYGSGNEAWKVDPTDESKSLINTLDAEFRSAGADDNGDYIYFTDGHGDFYRFDSSGNKKWGPLSKSFNYGGTDVVTSAFPGRAIKHSGDTVYAIKPDKSEAWQFTKPSGTAGDVKVLDNYCQIVAGDHDDNLYVLDFQGNEELNASTSYGYHNIAVDLSADYIYGVDDNGHFHAVDITVTS